eukprot:466308-Rhodomonas_salina.2
MQPSWQIHHDRKHHSRCIVGLHQQIHRDRNIRADTPFGCTFPQDVNIIPRSCVACKDDIRLIRGEKEQTKLPHAASRIPSDASPSTSKSACSRVD